MFRYDGFESEKTTCFFQFFKIVKTQIAILYKFMNATSTVNLFASCFQEKIMKIYEELMNVVQTFI